MTYHHDQHQQVYPDRHFALSEEVPFLQIATLDQASKQIPECISAMGIGKDIPRPPSLSEEFSAEKYPPFSHIVHTSRSLPQNFHQKQVLSVPAATRAADIVPRAPFAAPLAEAASADPVTLSRLVGICSSPGNQYWSAADRMGPKFLQRTLKLPVSSARRLDKMDSTSKLKGFSLSLAGTSAC